MTDQNTDKKSRPGLTLLVLLLMFSIPPALAWYLLNFTDAGISSGTINSGMLINPVRKFPDMNLYDAYADTERPLYGKWNMIYVHEGACEEFCQEKLYKMQQVRIATNKYAHRLQRVIVLTRAEQTDMATILQKYQGLLIMRNEAIQQQLMSQFQLKTNEALGKTGRIYIMDPLGNLMMVYEDSADPKGMIKDLKRLIKLSRIG